SIGVTGGAAAMPRYSVFAVRALAALVALLRLQAQGRDRPRVEPAPTDRLCRHFAIAVGAILDPRQRLVDLRHQFALAVAGAQFERAVAFHRGAVVEIGMGQAVVL